MVLMAADRICPHCQAPNPLGARGKCVRCKKTLPEYCFACSAAIPDESTPACPSCGRRRWVFGDFTELACAFENGRRRQHRYMTTLMKGGRVMHEWRCMTCFSDETRTDASAHFPDRPLAQV
jgi:hypothetical protein